MPATLLKHHNSLQLEPPLKRAGRKALGRGVWDPACVPDVHKSYNFNNNTFLLTGATGFLGKSVIRYLTSQLKPKPRIISIQRPNSTAGLEGSYFTKLCDLRQLWLCSEELLEADYILWMASLRDHHANARVLWDHNVLSIESAIQILKHSDRLKRFIYISSISAVDHAEFPYRPINDESVPTPQIEYGRSKLEAERRLLMSGLPVCILRLPFLYGPYFRKDSFTYFCRRAAYHPILGRIRYTGNLSLLFTGDVGPLMIELLSEKNSKIADSSPYVVSDGNVYEFDDVVSLVARLHHRERQNLRIPGFFGKIANGILGYTKMDYLRHAAFARDFFVVDSTRLRAGLRFTFTPLDLALIKTYGLTLESATALRRRETNP